MPNFFVTASVSDSLRLLIAIVLDYWRQLDINPSAIAIRESNTRVLPCRLKARGSRLEFTPLWETCDTRLRLCASPRDPFRFYLAFEDEGVLPIAQSTKESRDALRPPQDPSWVRTPATERPFGRSRRVPPRGNHSEPQNNGCPSAWSTTHRASATAGRCCTAAFRFDLCRRWVIRVAQMNHRALRHVRYASDCTRIDAWGEPPRCASTGPMHRSK